MNRRYFLIPALALLWLLAAMPAGAQTPRTFVTLNSYSCPADYDQVADCEKIGGVVLSVTMDGEIIDEVTTEAASGVEVDLLSGTAVSVEVVGGAPAGTVLEAANLSFTAEEGANAVTLVFIPDNVQPEPVDSDEDGLTDDEEAELGTDPNAYDTDGDGVSDGGEVNAGTDPLETDTDGDGFDDQEELDAGSDPLDADSVPSDDEPGSLTVHAFLCPAGYDGIDFVNDCDEQAGVEFSLGVPDSETVASGTTDDNGVVAFGEVGVGPFVLVAEYPVALADLDVYCAPPGDTEPKAVDYIGTEGVEFEILAGEDVTCSWFATAAGDDDDDVDPTPTPKPDTKPAKDNGDIPVKVMPNTGTGSSSDDGHVNTVILLALAVGLMTGGLIARRRFA